jgi:hypothetical protein
MRALSEQAADVVGAGSAPGPAAVLPLRPIRGVRPDRVLTPCEARRILPDTAPPGAAYFRHACCRCTHSRAIIFQAVSARSCTC